MRDQKKLEINFLRKYKKQIMLKIDCKDLQIFVSYHKKKAHNN